MSEKIPPNWGDFNRDAPDAAPARIATGLDELCAVALTGPAGEKMLEALRAVYFEAPFNPAAPEVELRVRATQQHFIRNLERARDRGNEKLAARAKAASAA